MKKLLLTGLLAGYAGLCGYAQPVPGIKLPPVDMHGIGTPPKTDPVYAANKGKIVFASQAAAVTVDQENEAEFKTSFTTGQTIYFLAFLPQSLSTLGYQLDSPQGNSFVVLFPQCRLKFYLDGKLAYSNSLLSLDTRKQYRPYLPGALQAAAGTHYESADLFKAFAEQNAASLATGSHQLKLEVVPYYGHPMDKEGSVLATGEITLSVSLPRGAPQRMPLVTGRDN